MLGTHLGGMYNRFADTLTRASLSSVLAAIQRKMTKDGVHGRPVRVVCDADNKGGGAGPWGAHANPQQTVKAAPAGG